MSQDDYIVIQVACDSDFSEIFIAELSQYAYESFVETEEGFEAYIPHAEFDREVLHELKLKYASISPFDFKIDKVEKKNWNEEWEKNYEPIFVDNRCAVRASFHAPMPQFEYEIIINPKMSFGTGHHATTHLMISYLLDMELQGKKTADLGCGTGILAIMAAKKQAKPIFSTDIDDWCIENSIENYALNGFPEIQIERGTAKELSFDSDFDLVIANINRNVLLDEMEVYAAMMKKGGTLLLSGFYEEDIAIVLERAEAFGLVKKEQRLRNNWAGLRLVKN